MGASPFGKAEPAPRMTRTIHIGCLRRVARGVKPKPLTFTATRFRPNNNTAAGEVPATGTEKN